MLYLNPQRQGFYKKGQTTFKNPQNSLQISSPTNTQPKAKWFIKLHDIKSCSDSISSDQQIKTINAQSTIPFFNSICSSLSSQRYQKKSGESQNKNLKQFTSRSVKNELLFQNYLSSIPQRQLQHRNTISLVPDSQSIIKTIEQLRFSKGQHVSPHQQRVIDSIQKKRIQTSFIHQKYVQPKVEQVQKLNAYDLQNVNLRENISRREQFIKQRRLDVKKPPLPINKLYRQSETKLNQTQVEFTQKSLNDIHLPEEKSFITADQSLNDIQLNNIASFTEDKGEQKQPIFPPRQIFFDDPQKEQDQIQKIIMETHKKNEIEKEQQKKLQEKKQNEDKQRKGKLLAVQTTDELEPKQQTTEKIKDNTILKENENKNERELQKEITKAKDKEMEKEKEKDKEKEKQKKRELNQIKQQEQKKMKEGQEENIDASKELEKKVQKFEENSEQLFKKVKQPGEEKISEKNQENQVEILNKNLKLPGSIPKNNLQTDTPKNEGVKAKFEDLQIVDLEELEAPKKQQEKPKTQAQTSYGKYIQKYQDYIKMVNQIGNMVAGCIELFEAQKNVWMIPLFLIFKRMCQIRTQIYNEINKEQNPFKITDFQSFKNSQDYKNFKEQFGKENEIVLKELSDVLIVAKRKLAKIDKNQAQKMEGFLNLNMEQNIKDQTFVYLYGQIYSKVKMNAVSPPLNAQKDAPKFSMIQWLRLQTLILTSLIILEIPLFNIANSSLAEDLIITGDEKDQIYQLQQIIQQRETQVEKLKVRLQEAGFPL